MKRTALIILMFFVWVHISCNKKKRVESPPPSIDLTKWIAPYFLEAPEGWAVERFAIPIEFAPEIPYTGVEDVRFAPGWGNSFTDEYWTYCFLWYLDGRPEITNEAIEKNLESYYAGLVGRNMVSRSIPATKYFKPKTSFKKIATANGDLETYTGTIYMLDYHSQKPITLNCTVHSKSCSAVKEKSFLFFEISPKPVTDAVWLELEKICTDFKCSK